MKLSGRDTRDFIILGSIVVVLSAYLVLRSRDRIRYELPELPVFEVSQVDAVQVEQGGDVVEIRRRGRDWLILPQDYPADITTIDNMIGTLAALNITELVSASEESHARYDLDQDSGVTVRALQKDQVLREVVVGRRAATFAHTYVRVAGDPRVFHAEGDLRSILVRSRDELRDRVVLRFPRGSVKGLRFSDGSGDVSVKKETENETTTWVTADGDQLEAEAVEQALDRLALLRATRYGDAAHSSSQRLARIVVEADETHELTLYQAEDGLYPADSSDSAYPFYINSVVADQLLAPFGRQ